MAMRLRGVSFLQPILEFEDIETFGCPKAFPSRLIVGEISDLGRRHIPETDHDLVLVELPGLRVHLVDDGHKLAFGIRANESIEVVLVFAFRSANVPVVMGKGGLPFLSFGAYSGSRSDPLGFSMEMSRP